ncbi:MAG: LysR family transcriptional regulator [Rhizobiaceae bacterium]
MGQIEDLKLFTIIVDQGSISRAANTMNIVKSAVSRRLSLLEERYGSRLIDRSPGNWGITTTGLELYQRALRVVGDVDEIESDFTEVTQNLSGPLTISVAREFGVSFLMPTLMAFKNSYPEIQLSVDFDDHMVDLSRDNYDFAIRITTELESNVVAKRIGTTRHLLCTARSYLALNGHPKTLEELGKHALLHFGSVKRARWNFQPISGKVQTIEFQPVLNSNSGVFLLEAAKNGIGIARLPDFICEHSIHAGEVVAILPDLTVSDGGIYLVHAKDRRINRRMRLFAETLEAACLPELY